MSEALTSAPSARPTAVVESREFELLRRCTRAAFGSDEGQAIAEIAGSCIDWDALIQDARTHGVLPLLCRTPFPPHVVPAGIRLRLDEQLSSNARRNLLLARELLKTLRLLEQQGIAAIALKGPGLAVLAYGDLALRQYSDLDLLVRQRDLRKTVAELAAHGYTTRLAPEKVEKELRSEHIHHLEMVDPSRRLLIELHWNLMPERFFFTPDLEQIWIRSVQQTLMGAAVRCLDPEDLVIFLCVHGWKHNWSRLIWVADLAGVIRNKSLNWQRLLRRAAKQGSKRRVLLGFALAKHLLGTRLPDLLEAQIRGDRSLGKLVREAERTLLTQEHSQPGRFLPYRQALEIGEGVSHRTKILYTFVRKNTRPNENDFAWISLPRPLFGLYYLLHPVRLAIGALARAFGRRS